MKFFGQFFTSAVIALVSAGPIVADHVPQQPYTYEQALIELARLEVSAQQGQISTEQLRTGLYNVLRQVSNVATQSTAPASSSIDATNTPTIAQSAAKSSGTSSGTADSTAATNVYNRSSTQGAGRQAPATTRGAGNEKDVEVTARTATADVYDVYGELLDEDEEEDDEVSSVSIRASSIKSSSARSSLRRSRSDDEDDEEDEDDMFQSDSAAHPVATTLAASALAALSLLAITRY